jgi:hypothetical protein
VGGPEDGVQLFLIGLAVAERDQDLFHVRQMLRALLEKDLVEPGEIYRVVSCR